MERWISKICLIPFLFILSFADEPGVPICYDSNGVVAILKEHYDPQVFVDTGTAVFVKGEDYIITHRDGVAIYPKSRWCIVKTQKVRK